MDMVAWAVKAAPTSPFEVAEPDLLLEVLITRLMRQRIMVMSMQAVEGDVP